MAMMTGADGLPWSPFIIPPGLGPMLPPPGLVADSIDCGSQDGLMPPVAFEVAAPITPLYKTRMCDFFKRGACAKGARCPYAHGEDDLRPSPNFEKTAVCPTLRSKGRCDNPKCRYAHATSEVRIAPSLMKTKMCSFHFSGLCDVGDACRFAHSIEELQDAVGMSKYSLSPTVTESTAAPTESEGSSGEEPMASKSSDEASCEDTRGVKLGFVPYTRLKVNAPLFVPSGLVPLCVPPLVPPGNFGEQAEMRVEE